MIGIRNSTNDGSSYIVDKGLAEKCLAQWEEPDIQYINIVECDI